MGGTGTLAFVDVRTHQQNDPSYCGMATAMMMLNFLDPANPRTELALRHQIGQTADSSAPPPEMQKAIEKLKGASNNTLSFAAVPYGSWSEANKAIVRTLHDESVPVPAQVWGKSHWLVVSGVLTDVVPVPGASFTLDGVFVNNPTPTPNEKKDQRHSDGDACGNEAGCGALHEFLSPDGWKAYFSGTPGGEFVCVTASGSPAGGSPAPLAAATFQGADPGSAAIDGIAAYGLGSLGPCAPFLQDPVAGDVQQVGAKPPALGYFLVTILHKADKSYAGFARVALDGTFLGVMVSLHEHRILTADEVAGIVTPQLVALPPSAESDGAPAPRRATPLVRGPFWRPCLESPSPYYPLYEIDAFDVAGHPRTLYATYDAKIRPTLTWFDVPPPARSAVVRKELPYRYE